MSFGLPPHLDAVRLGAVAAFARAGADQFALEFRKAAEDRQHQAPVRLVVSAQVSPSERNPAPAFGDRVERVEQVARRARQPVKARHHQHVAGGELVERAAQLRAVGLGAAGSLAKHLLGSGGAQLLHLRVNALAVRRYSCIAVNHALLMHVISAQKKPLFVLWL